MFGGFSGLSLRFSCGTFVFKCAWNGQFFACLALKHIIEEKSSTTVIIYSIRFKTKIDSRIFNTKLNTLKPNASQIVCGLNCQRIKNNLFSIRLYYIWFALNFHFVYPRMYKYTYSIFNSNLMRFYRFHNSWIHRKHYNGCIVLFNIFGPSQDGNKTKLWRDRDWVSEGERERILKNVKHKSFSYFAFALSLIHLLLLVIILLHFMQNDK